MFYKQLEHLDLYLIIGHRIIWAFVFLLCVMIWMGRIGQLREVFARPRDLVPLVFTSLLLGSMWAIYVWAVLHELIIEASLGYFMAPIISVVLGLTIFKEHLSRLQIIAVGLAMLGVLCQILLNGIVPWVGLVLGGTFSLYSTLRKRMNMKPFCGSLLESMYLLPVGLAVILINPATSHTPLDMPNLTLLILSGAITILPLVWYITAAQLMPLVILGTLFYLAPTLGFLSGVLVYHEPFTTGHGIMFVLIISGLAIFTWDAFKKNQTENGSNQADSLKYKRL